jgi:hypothetical protein
MSKGLRQINQRLHAAQEVNRYVQVARGQAITRYYLRKRG